jgi:hypothetical protein
MTTREFLLHPTSATPEKVVGTWTDGTEQRPFVYAPSKGRYDGVFTVRDEDVSVYEYDVVLKWSANGEFLGGKGSNRYGHFVLTPEWVKRYTSWFPEIRVDAGFLVAKKRRDIARWLRVVFKDRYWDVERSVLRGRATYDDVLAMIMGEEGEAEFRSRCRLLHQSRRETVRQGRAKRLKDVQELERKVTALEEQVRSLRERVAPHRVPAAKRLLLERAHGTRFHSKLFADWRGEDLFGVVKEAGGPWTVSWLDMSDALVEYVAERVPIAHK